MKNIKYTSDGKKVTIIGNLNPKEIIVQEIFITKEGAEIPSGENFIVKSLHDEPVISWKEKNIKSIDEEYKKKNSEHEIFLNNYRTNEKKTQGLLKEKLSYLRKVIDNISEDSFKMMEKHLLGKYKYYIDSDYRPEIHKIKNFDCSYHDNKFKLLSLYGNDKGDLNFRLHSYSDGSGGSNHVYFFETKKEAIKRLKEIILSKNQIRFDDIEKSLKYNFELDKNKVDEFINIRKSELNKTIDSYKRDINLKDLELKKIQDINNG